MRLIVTDGSNKADWTPRLRTRRGKEPYAILSHRWHEDPSNEVLFADIEEINQSVTGPVKNPQYAGTDPRVKAGFSKLQGAAQHALIDGYGYIWIDTCCIDKNSSAELSEAINSMFKWYGASGVCYVYLVDCAVFDIDTAQGKAQFMASQWWTRGWTLQELLAPLELIFFTSTWAEIGRKDDLSLTADISEVSGIEINVLNGTIPLDSISVAQRMSWAAKRETSRIEDMAYSLIGIFSINMPLLYGEGQTAFLRLQQEIMKESDDETIFAWIDTTSKSPYRHDDGHFLNGLLAAHPSAFGASHHVIQQHTTEIGTPFAMTNRGLSISFPLEEVDQGLYIAWLRCLHSATNTRIGIYLKNLSPSTAQYARVRSFEWAYNRLHARINPTPLYVKQHHDQIPAYRELDYEQRGTRFIQVLPTEDAPGLKLRLLSANIRTAKYTALSYVWDRTDHCNVLINSEQVGISKKLFAFLQNARYRSMNTLYWIDAICIQQQSAPDKQHQISLMADIFRHASQVLVLLNSSAPTVIDEYEEISSSTLVSNSIEINNEVFMMIVKHKYWTRAWLLQEFLLARDIVLQVNQTRIPILTFARKYYDNMAVMEPQNVQQASALHHIEPFLRFAKSTKCLSAEVEYRHYIHPFGGEPLQLRFEELLYSFRHLKCGMRLDRVYALLTISDLGPDFRVNYSDSREDLLVRVMAARGDRLTDEALSLLQEALNTNIDKAELDRRLTKIKNGTGTEK